MLKTYSLEVVLMMEEKKTKLWILFCLADSNNAEKDVNFDKKLVIYWVNLAKK